MNPFAKNAIAYDSKAEEEKKKEDKEKKSLTKVEEKTEGGYCTIM